MKLKLGSTDKSQQHIAVDLAKEGADTTVIMDVKKNADGAFETKILDKDEMHKRWNKSAHAEDIALGKYDDRLPTVNICQVPSWAMHIECPHCHEILNDWMVNPEHSIQTCSMCGKQFNVARDIAMEIT